MAIKNETSSKKLLNEKFKEAQTNRMMLIFLLLLVADFALLYFKNAIDNAPIDSFLSLGFFPGVKYYLPIPAILFITALIYKLVKKNDDKLKLFTPTLLLGLSAVLLTVFIILCIFWNNGFLFSIIFVTVSALLYFILVTFARSFFVFSFFNAFAAFTIYLIRWLESPHSIVIGGLLIAFAVTFSIFVLCLKKNGGTLFNYSLLSSNSDYMPLMCACLLYLIFIVAAMFLPQFTLYYIIAIALETLIFGIFYSIKMLK